MLKSERTKTSLLLARALGVPIQASLLALKHDAGTCNNLAQWHHWEA